MDEDRIAPIFKGRHIFLTGGNKLLLKFFLASSDFINKI